MIRNNDILTLVKKIQHFAFIFGTYYIKPPLI